MKKDVVKSHDGFAHLWTKLILTNRILNFNEEMKKENRNSRN